jgi:hypothetical protein
MFEEFSGGYYLGRLYVSPTDDDRVLMHDHQHEQINEFLYASGEGVERLDAPVVMKLGDAHLAVHGDESVPADTLSVPEELLADRVRDPPALREVLLAKAGRARQLLEMTTGYRPTEMT